jgi:hypothetical protein
MRISIDTVVMALAILAHGWAPRLCIDTRTSAIVSALLNTLAILIVIASLVLSYWRR